MTLVQELWDLLTADGGGPFLTDVQKQELQRRAAEDDAMPADVVPWDQVRADILSRLSRTHPEG